MKTAYCILGLSNCGVIKFSDELLKRIEELKAVVLKTSENLTIHNPWKENVSITINYGGMKWEVKDGVYNLEFSADGPVLAYDHSNYPGHRCADESVMITIGSDDAFVESYHEEGSENPLGYDRPENGNNLDYTIGTIPDIFFSSGFLRAWCEHLGNHHFRMHKEVMHVVEDMPEEHRALLAKATEAYLEENKEALMEIKDIEQSVICESCDRYINEAYGKLTEGEKLRLGLDLHGVIDDDKKYFSNLSKKILNRGGEVHVITGSKDTKELREKIAGLGIAYSHIFSISSHHEKKGTKVWEDDRGPWMDVEVWNRSKADYCREKRIHIHIDDSPIYGRYFDPQTIYIKYPEMEVINEARKI